MSEHDTKKAKSPLWLFSVGDCDDWLIHSFIGPSVFLVVLMHDSYSCDFDSRNLNPETCGRHFYAPSSFARAEFWSWIILSILREFILRVKVSILFIIRDPSCQIWGKDWLIDSYNNILNFVHLWSFFITEIISFFLISWKTRIMFTLGIPFSLNAELSSLVVGRSHVVLM